LKNMVSFIYFSFGTNVYSFLGTVAAILAKLRLKIRDDGMPYSLALVFVFLWSSEETDEASTPQSPWP